jgi:hypothetical protein
MTKRRNSFGRDQTVDIPNFSGTTYLAITQHLQKGPNYIDPAGAVSRGQINFTFSVFCQRFDILPTTCDSALERRARRRGQTGSYASVTARGFGTYLSCQNTCLGSSSIDCYCSTTRLPSIVRHLWVKLLQRHFT